MLSESHSSNHAHSPVHETTPAEAAGAPTTRPKKLHGRAFYESIGSPRFIIAPMVDQSEFAWRMLTRSFLPPSQRSKILAYSPMLHARLFADSQKYRQTHFEPTCESASTAPSSRDDSCHPQLPVPYLDGNPSIDRPLFVQFCANDPAALLSAAELVAPHCDAVDLNLGCPQGIAKRGNYGAFLQEDQDLIYRLIRTLHENLPIPVTAKIRILDTREATLAYARNVLAAGASILTVHGRRREQKGHMTGLADWDMIRYLRENLPPETVLFANGNVLQLGDLERCLAATGADGVMSAEGNLSDPAIFAPVPAVGEEGREYWRGKYGRGGWRVDAVMRRYLDILHRYVLGAEPPDRRPLFLLGDDTEWLDEAEEAEEEQQQPPKKKQKRDKGRVEAPAANFIAAQAHLFHLLRHFVSRHTDVRDRLARTGGGNIAGYEKVLAMVERRVAEGLLEYERTGGKSFEESEEVVASVNGKENGTKAEAEEEAGIDDPESSARAVKACRRPWWIAQPIVRPLPKEAIAKGAITLKKDKPKPKPETDAKATEAPAEQADAVAN